MSTSGSIEPLGSAMPEMYILCQLADTLIALPGRAVRYIEFVMRAQVVPLVSLRLRFGLPWRPHDLRSRVIVIRHGERTVGLLADSAHDVVHVSPAEIQPLTEGVAQLNLALLDGAFPRNSRLVLIARVEALIDSEVMPASPPTAAN